MARRKRREARSAGGLYVLRVVQEGELVTVEVWRGSARERSVGMEVTEARRLANHLTHVIADVVLDIKQKMGDE